MASIRLRIGEGCGIHAHFVGARFKHLLGVARGTDAAADGERNEQFARSAAHRVEKGLAALVRRGDVEKYDFIGAFAGVARGLRGGIAGIDEIDKLNAFDDTAIVDVEAGDDALGQHVAPTFQLKKLRRIFSPVSPDFSG